MPKTSVKKHNNSNKNKEITFNYIAFNCFINALISFVVFVLLSFILSLITKENMQIKQNSKTLILIILSCTSALNGLLCVLRLKQRAIVTSSISSLFMAVLVFILFCIVGNFSFTYNSLISIAIVFCVCIVSAIVFKNILNK